MTISLDGSAGITFPNNSTQSAGGLIGSTAQLAKAWCNYNGSSQTITSSYNISSVTRQSAGQYTFNFTSALSQTPAAVAISGSAGYWTIVAGSYAFSSSAVSFASYINGTGYADNTPFCMIAFAT
jgi:hypothetical protein